MADGMKRFLLPWFWFGVSLAAIARTAEEDYQAQLGELDQQRQKIQDSYRAARAKELLAATKVEVFITRYDDIEMVEGLFAAEDNDKRIRIDPYNASTAILQRKELAEAERKELMAAFAKQLAVPRQTGGALCHYPIHGLRIYSGEDLLHSGTFCWKCGNWGFRYPDGSSDWLDTSEELEKLFSKLLPIPEEERKRFKAENPESK